MKPKCQLNFHISQVSVKTSSSAVYDHWLQALGLLTGPVTKILPVRSRLFSWIAQAEIKL